jgi:ATP-dependent Clp protease ATP-binding subunit ClpC
MFVWSAADAETQQAKALEIEPVHFLLGLTKLAEIPEQAHINRDDEENDVLMEITAEAVAVRKACNNCGLNTTRLRRKLRATLPTPAASVYPSDVLHRSDASRDVFKKASRLASDVNCKTQPIHLLAALLDLDDVTWWSVFDDLHIDKDALRQAAREAVEPATDVSADDVRKEKKAFLGKYGRDLTELARDGKLEPIIGRHAEMRNLIQVLLQKRKSNAALIGPAGVGKTGIVEGLAQRIVSDKPPRGLEGKRIVEITMSSLVAGTKYRGEFEERMQKLIAEASAEPDLILFIDEFHTMMDAGGEGAGNAANILKPALARGELSCIGATTIDEYRKHIERDPAVERRFQVVWVEQSTAEETVKILQGIKCKMAEHHGVEIGDDAINAAVEFSVRYLPDLNLPDKAIDLIDQACAAIRILSFPQGSMVSGPVVSRTIGRSDIAKVVSARCRIPVEQLSGDQAERLLQMEEEIKRRVVGQDEAVAAVCETVRTAQAGLKDPNRPVGVFLFVGSTGTGKTELAKAVAEFLFAKDNRLIRLDMSEFMEEHSVSKLIGSPPGYVGHDEQGHLTGALRSNPYSVVLFDEIEKAHPRVLDLFLQIFDEGQLTDSKGRKASFRDAVIILTSNLGSAVHAINQESEPFGFAALHHSPDKQQNDLDQPAKSAYTSQILHAVTNAMRPEIVNRIDNIVYFYPLSREAVRRIIDKMIDQLRSRLADRNISLELCDHVYDVLMQAGYNPEYGAREMKRAVDRLIIQPLGKALLEGKYKHGEAIQLIANDGQVAFN